MKTTTERRTTTEKQTCGAVVNFYCWNNEFKLRFEALYDGVEESASDGSYTTLRDGSQIHWIMSPNYSDNYQTVLTSGLENDLVDIFCVESDYSCDYMNSEYVASLADFGLNQTHQYRFTKQVGLNDDGNFVFTTWQICAGAMAYNKNVAEAVFGNEMSTQEIENQVNYSSLDEIAQQCVNAGKNMFIGPDDWFRTYICNLTSKMQGKERYSMTIDRKLFEWAKKTKEYVDAGYIKSAEDSYGLWGSNWGYEQAKNNVLFIYTCPWYDQYTLPSYVNPDDTGDLGYRLIKSNEPFYWGGTWVGATNKALNDESVSGLVGDILGKMTTDKDVLRELTLQFGDVANDNRVLDELAQSEEGNSALFGGQNTISVYRRAAKEVDLLHMARNDWNFCEIFQSKFRRYFRGEQTLDQAVLAVIEEIKTRLYYNVVKIDPSVQIVDQEIVLL